MRRIHPAAGAIEPFATCERPRCFGLDRRQHDKLQTRLSQQLESNKVDGRFRQPHRFGRAPEPALEIREAPLNLRPFIAKIRERKNHVVIGLRERRPMAAKSLLTRTVGLRSCGMSPAYAIPSKKAALAQS